MSDSLLQNFATVYGLAYFGAVILVALWEGGWPLRSLDAPIRTRWVSNICIALIDNALWRLLIPVSAISVALVCAERGIGLLHSWEVLFWIGFVLSLLLIDLVKYLVHYGMHRLPWLWRLHRMHHTDQDYDFTIGLRFHPFEALLSPVIYLAVIAVLGAPVLAVMLSELVLVVLAIVSHGNIRVPRQLDSVGRWFIVTPDMHRVHHSTNWVESNSNFGIVFPWWDRLFGSYCAQPAAGHDGMGIGLRDFRAREHLTLVRMLLDPFMTPPPATETGGRDVGTEVAPP